LAMITNYIGAIISDKVGRRRLLRKFFRNPGPTSLGSDLLSY
jgi:hypothetical protein